MWNTVSAVARRSAVWTEQRPRVGASDLCSLSLSVWRTLALPDSAVAASGDCRRSFHPFLRVHGSWNDLAASITRSEAGVQARWERRVLVRDSHVSRDRGGSARLSVILPLGVSAILPDGISGRKPRDAGLHAQPCGQP